jgi:DNA-binding transcriptional regulator YdaS (Cro superfamily)
MRKETVIKFFGSARKASSVLGISRASVSQWGEIIPEKQALRLDRETKGELKYTSALYKQVSEAECNN